MLSDFSRVNRRMHNKSITADNQITIVGGRNIGDEYFEASTVMNYGDLDALAIGEAVAAVSDIFDRYWNSPVVYGIAELRDDPPPSTDIARAAAGLRAFERQQRDARYTQAMRESPLSQELRDGRVAFTAARIEVTADDPGKVEQAGRDGSQNLMPQLRAPFDRARESVVLVSPVLRAPQRRGGVPEIPPCARSSREGAHERLRVDRRGGRVQQVQEYRRQLLEAGVELYELDPAHDHRGPQGPRQPSERPNASEATTPRAGLHGKIISFDCLQFFVGLMNLDPRSAFTNTEIGFLVDAPDAAALLCEGLDQTLARTAFRVQLTTSSNGARHMEWVETDEGRERRFTSEPGGSRWKRVKAWMYGIMPIESLM